MASLWCLSADGNKKNALLIWDLIKHTGHDVTPQIITDCGNTSVPLQFSSKLWDLDFRISNQPQSSSFSLSPGDRRLMSVVQEWLHTGNATVVDRFLKTSLPGVCTDSSLTRLLVRLSQVPESTLLDSFLNTRVIPVSHLLLSAF